MVPDGVGDGSDPEPKGSDLADNGARKGTDTNKLSELVHSEYCSIIKNFFPNLILSFNPTIFFQWKIFFHLKTWRFELLINPSSPPSPSHLTRPKIRKKGITWGITSC